MGDGHFFFSPILASISVHNRNASATIQYTRGQCLHASPPAHAVRPIWILCWLRALPGWNCHALTKPGKRIRVGGWEVASVGAQKICVTKSHKSCSYVKKVLGWFLTVRSLVTIYLESSFMSILHKPAGEKKPAKNLPMNRCQIGSGWFGFSGQQWGRSRKSGGSRLAEIKSGNSDERPSGKWIELWGGKGGGAPSPVSSALFGSTQAQLIPKSQLDKLSIC